MAKQNRRRVGGRGWGARPFQMSLFPPLCGGEVGDKRHRHGLRVGVGTGAELRGWKPSGRSERPAEWFLLRSGSAPGKSCSREDANTRIT